MKIDLHSHFVPRDCFDLTDKQGINYGPSIARDASGQEILMADGRSEGLIVAKICDPKRRIQDMDEIGLDMQAISISPPSIVYSVDGEEGLGFCRKHNDRIAEVVTAYPDRFVGMATVPMQDMSRAVPELERAVNELGLRAVEIISNINGKNLDEPEFWPFYQKAQDLDILIYVHPINVAGADRLQKYLLLNLIGNPTDTAISIASIIFGGVLEKFPRLKFLFSHAGGSTPFIKGRWEHGYYSRTEPRSIPKPPSEYLKLMYFDTIAHYQPALAFMIDTHGIDRIVLGSDYPFAMGDLDPVSTVQSLAELSPKDKQKIFWDNAVPLLKL